jgi:hypothetical protein
VTEQRRLIAGGRIFTGDPEKPWAEAAVVEGNCFAFVGSSREAVSFAGPAAEKIDCAGELILPGFVDGHVHVVMTGASLLKAQLRDAVGLEQIQGRIRDWAFEHRDAPRVLATGWVQGSLEEGAPTREMLDAVVDDRPVYVAAHDLHSCWVNSAALRELKITNSTPDPVGGRIVRNADTGEATGHLFETVMTERIWPLLNNISEAETDRQLAAALDAYSRSGITSAVEMALEAQALKAMARAEAKGGLGVRIVAHVIIHRGPDADGELAQVAAAGRMAAEYTGDRLRVGGIKIISDGTIDGCTAALLEPYSNGLNAEPIWDADSLKRVVVKADAEGLQVAIHAIGDRAIRSSIDALEHAAQVNGTSGRRHRIEHLEYAADEDIARLGALGITASMQPVHVDPSILGNWIEMLGVERGQNGMAWPRYIETGATLALGTDTPTAPFEPIPNMYIAATRASPSDPSLPAHRPEWALPLEEAILHGTRESAYAAWLDHVTGAIKVGLAADMVVLDRDVFAEGPKALLETSIRLTMMDGRVTFSAEADA